MTFNIVLAGPRGRMGRETIKMLTKNTSDFNLVACIDNKNGGKRLKDLDSEFFNLDIPIFENPLQCFEKVNTNLFLDLSVTNASFNNSKIALQNLIYTVIGVSGLEHEQISQLAVEAEETQTGCIIAPNFSIGAILMMQFSQKAAKYFPNVEIIEKHHDNKVDAPSGTLINTIDLIKKVRETITQGSPQESENIIGARGGVVDGMRLHSVRLPGLVAQQEVMLGGSKQMLTIKHESFHRESFMEGIQLALKEVINLKTLVYGLDNFIE